MHQVTDLDVEALERDALAAYAAAATPAELTEANARFLGRKSALKQALRGIRDPETGRVLNDLRGRLEQAQHAAEQRLSDAALTSQVEFDVTLPGERVERGHLHLITQIRREVEDIFLGLGYEVIDGREVETTHYNFDALNFPDWHPSRSPRASLFVDPEQKEVVLRTETSPSQIRTMEERDPPIYMISTGRVYRRDTPDATHTPIFHQVEGLAVDGGITLADLKGTLLYLMRALFGEDREVRFATHYFPFTEPSMEAYVSCFLCEGRGCPVCKHSGWIEIGGSGVVDPALFEFVGYDPEEVSGFAFGWGLERIAVLRHRLPDLRELWRNDLRLTRQF